MPRLPGRIMSRFVLLRHEVPAEFGRPSHFDLMLQSESSLLTWEINQIPPSGQSVEAVQLPNHRLLYLDYEGPISANRGEVRRVDHGRCDVEHPTVDRVIAHIAGQTLCGSILLDRVNLEQWRLTYEEHP